MLTNITVYNPHANEDDPALVPRVVEPGKPTPTPTPSQKKPNNPPLEKKLPLLPEPAAFPPSDAPVSCPMPAKGAPAPGTPPTKPVVKKRTTPEQDQAALLQKNEVFQKALKAEKDLIIQINKAVDAVDEVKKQAATPAFLKKPWSDPACKASLSLLFF
jgi:hypothetical protein